MGLKFRRGTNAQKSGSLAFGEPYVNTDLGTLQIGGLTGDITLGASGTGSAGLFSGISGSSLDITGNAKIDGNLTLGGNITIGDNTSDTLAVTANLSSSLIPSTTNVFDIGSSSKIYRTIFGGTISGSALEIMSGSNPEIRLINKTTGIAYHLQNGDSGNLHIHNGTTGNVLVRFVSASAGVWGQDIQTFGNLSVSKSISSPTITGLNTFTASVDTKFTTLQTLTASIAAQVSRLQESTASLNAFSASENTKAETLRLYTASVDTKFTTLQTLTASTAAQISRLQESTASLNTFSASNGNTSLNAYTQSNTTTINAYGSRLDRLQESTASLNAFTNSFNNAIQLTGSNVNIAGNLTIAGTTTTVNSTNVAIADAVIELNYGGAVVRGGILVKDGTGGSNVSGSLLWDGTNDQWIAGVSGSESKILRAGSDGVISGSSQVDITATTNYTTFSGSIASSISSSVAAATWTNISGKPSGLVSGSSQVVDILTSLNIFSGSENTKAETLRLYTASVDTKFTTLATYTGSNDTTNTTQNTRLSRIEESTSSLNVFSASQNTKDSTLALYTASVDTKFSTLQTLTASMAAIDLRLQESTASLNAFSASENTKNSTLALYTASVDTKFTTLQTLTASMTAQVSRIQESTASLNSYTSSNDTTNTTQNTRLSRIEESTASLNAFSASQLVKDSTLQAYTASVDTKFSTLATYTGSNDTTNTTQNTRLTRLEEATSSLNSLTGSYARTNTTNVFTGNQTITGSLFISQDLIVQGSSSIQTISSSRLDIGDNIVQLNVNSPSLRFGGLAIVDSGSAGGSGSFLYDSVEDEFIFVHRGNGTNVTSSHFVLGPETYDNLGNETYLTINRLSKGTGKEHLVDSNITDTGTLITLGSNTVVNGTLVASGTSLVSSSAQVNYTQLSGISANIISASTDSSNVDFIISGGSITANLFGGVVSGSSQVVGILTSLNEFSASENTKSATLATFTSSLATTYEGRASAAKTIFSGSSQVVGSAITTNTITIGSTSTALGGTSTTLAGLTSVSSTGFTGALTGNASTATTLATARTINGTSFNGSADITIANLVSASAQIDHNATTNYVANRHIDHTAVSISAGNGLTGGGDISATRTLTLDTTSATFTTGVKSKLDVDGVISGSKTISGITLGSNLATLTIGTGLSGTSYNGSTGVTIANTGVTSNVAGTGISVSGATGAVTITNSGVTSIVAGTGVSRDSATGAVTISIGQAVATSSNVQFNSLGIGMAASATAGRIDATNDIVAYSSSDIRFKENIKPIENALQKISKISGNTYDWKAENKIEHGYEGNDVGVIAQEIEEVLPQLVQTRENGYKAVKYDKLVALLIEGIKEQQTQIHSLTIEIEKLKESKGL